MAEVLRCSRLTESDLGWWGPWGKAIGGCPSEIDGGPYPINRKQSCTSFWMCCSLWASWIQLLNCCTFSVFRYIENLKLLNFQHKNLLTFPGKFPHRNEKTNVHVVTSDKWISWLKHISPGLLARITSRLFRILCFMGQRFWKKYSRQRTVTLWLDTVTSSWHWPTSQELIARITSFLFWILCFNGQGFRKK